MVALSTNYRAVSHALVLGGSMAGALAARVLAEFYDLVTVVERDPFPASPTSRRGVPQGRHVHVLQPRGHQILEQLFPGFTKDLLARGAMTGDLLADTHFIVSGNRFQRAPCGVDFISATRPLIDSLVGSRLASLPNVSVLAGWQVDALSLSPDGRRVVGATIMNTDSTTASRVIRADLVVDATGRASRLPTWLTELGYPQPITERVEIGLRYATRLFRLHPEQAADNLFTFVSATPDRPRSGVLAAVEGGLHMLSLGGILGDRPPTDLDGFTDFANDLIVSDIAMALKGSTATSDTTVFRFPASVRHRYEHLHRFPAGLIPLGDSICSFNPVYGQGMTVAGLQALTLKDLLANGDARSVHDYFSQVSTMIDSPWSVAVSADLAFAGVRGERTAQVDMANSYLPLLHASASVDPLIGIAFLRVASLIDPPDALFAPDLMRRVEELTSTIRGPQGADR